MFLGLMRYVCWMILFYVCASIWVVVAVLCWQCSADAVNCVGHLKTAQIWLVWGFNLYSGSLYVYDGLIVSRGKFWLVWVCISASHIDWLLVLY